MTGPGPFLCRGFRWTPGVRKGWYSTLNVKTPADLDRQHEIEITVSPTGRSVQVFVDGKKWTP